MSKVTRKPPIAAPAADAPTEGADIDAILRLSKESTARQRAREPGRKTPRDGPRGLTRDELYERGSPVAD